MGLEIKMRVPLGPTAEQYRPDRRLWLNADGTKVVEDGDPEAAILYATPATLIPLKDAEKYGLVKKREKPADKQRHQPHEDKSATDEEEEVEYYEDMKVDRLKELLAERGLEVEGKKQELIDRLVEDDDKLKGEADG